MKSVRYVVLAAGIYMLGCAVSDEEIARRASEEKSRHDELVRNAREASALVAERDFPTSREGIEQRLDTIDSLIDGEAWVNALKNGEALQQELLPLFGSSLADAPEVVSIRTRLDDALRIARREENVLRRAEERSQRLRASIERALGTSNRNVQRVSIAELQGERLFVQWAINDNLTAGMIRGAARLDIRDMLEVIADSREPYTNVFFRGTFSLVDQLGNASETNVVEATFTKSTIDRINFENFLTDNVYVAAEDTDIHPTFR